MNIHEHQAKQILKKYGAVVPEGVFALDVDELIVQSAYVGKNMVLKRGRPRARGRYGRILKPFSQITIVVRENREEE